MCSNNTWIIVKSGYVSNNTQFVTCINSLHIVIQLID